MIISLPRFTGEAALVRDAPNAVLAHQGPKDLFVANRNYTIDGTDFKVLSSSLSQYVPTVVLVKLRELYV